MAYSPVAMPYVDGLVMEVLRGSSDLTSVGIGTLQPSDITLRLPYIVASVYGGNQFGDGRFSIRPDLQVDCYHTSRPAAAALAEAVRSALVGAWLNQTSSYENGTIARVVVTSAPAQMPEAIDGVVRWHATYQLTVRPPAAVP